MTKETNIDNLTILLAIILFVAFLGVSFYAYSLENKYNSVVMDYNDCQNKLYNFTKPPLELPEFNPGDWMPPVKPSNNTK